MSTTETREEVVFDNLVEANEVKENFGDFILMPDPSEPVNNPNAKGTIKYSTTEEITQRAIGFATRIKS